jgi:hypothetical protein
MNPINKALTGIMPRAMTFLGVPILLVSFTS